MKLSSLLYAGAALAFSASTAMAAAHVMTEDTSAGMVLASADGMTLYTYDEDADGKSMCMDDCAANWPPFAAEEGAMADGEYSIIERDDGTKQWAYDGKPLYFFVDDLAVGDVNGDGKGGVWHVVMSEE